MKKLSLYFIVLFLLFSFISCSKMADTTADVYSEGGESGGNEQIEPGQITAGEWNDLLNWSFWDSLLQENDYYEMQNYWMFNLHDRISVNVKNQNSENLCNIKVLLLSENDEVLWESVTDNHGNAELWPLQLHINVNIFSKLKIKVGNRIYDDIKYYYQGVNNFTVYTDVPNSTKEIDIAFIVDATGSMGDELNYIKVELVDIIERVRNDNLNSVINTATVFYRDKDDLYVTKKSDFTENITETIEFINNQSAAGGGDFPEAVHTALDQAINELMWTENSISKIAFLILDAPPHSEDDVIEQIHELVYTASANGIKIIPVTASGIDTQTEFLMRYFSIATNGTYVFITNHSGIGNEHLEPTVGQYEVEFLNDLMVRLINYYLE